MLPKALTPGVRPMLFHNNHSWEGENALTSLFQGTGALAILLSGVVCALLLQRRSPRSSPVRLFLIWMAYSGLFQALPQVVIGAISPASDVGMAMNYLRLGSTARTAAALVALALIPPAALWLTGHLLSAAEQAAQLSSTRERTRFIGCGIDCLPTQRGSGTPARVPASPEARYSFLSGWLLSRH